MMVAISGIDGSGKTTIAREVVQRLNESGLDAVYSRPKYKACKQFEFYLLQSTGEATSFDRQPESSFYVSALMLDWLTHTTDFLCLHRDKVIVMDRYVLDVLAQCRHFNGPEDQFEWFKGRMPAAELEFFLNVSPDEAFSRISKRGAEIRKFESRQALDLMQGIYDRLLASDFSSVERLSSQSVSETVQSVTHRIFSQLEVRHQGHEHGVADLPRAPLCPHCDSYLYP